ncbi:MAG: toll/interleukin-1 receptor domain-containing protein [Saprospiraceae bacterium]|nr:toll/interleukin-1 receptor domain-containing protein [Saprospiraceae bacterium]
MSVKKIFISYAHEDESYKDQIVKHLRNMERNGLVEIWQDGMIQAGSEWDDAIRSKLFTADLILLLISPDFNDSDYIWKVELEGALERHKRKEAVIIPVSIRTADWKDTPYERFQALPGPGIQPVAKYADKDEAYLKIAQGIRQLVQSLG